MASPPPPARPPRLAAESWPDGVEPLSNRDAQFLDSECRDLIGEIRTAARRAPGDAPLAERVLDELERRPPHKLSCHAMLRRAMVAELARKLEDDAGNELKRIAVGLVRAAEAGKSCPSAPPVPATTAELERGSYPTKAEDWAVPAWQCIGFSLAGPQRYQYELRLDGAGGFEAIARGYPVRGAPLSELFLTGRVDRGFDGLSSDVMRR